MTTPSIRTLCIPVAFTLLVALSACNAKEKKTEDIYTPSSSTAITGFSLAANDTIAAHLDSVFFSIDLDRAVVFNADSLPLGTDVRRLVANISLSGDVSAAVVRMDGGTHRTGEFDYLETPADTIDFTGRVTLEVTAADHETVRSYDIKVNVHRTLPDTLQWSREAVAPLPSRLPAPRAQKTLSDKSATLCMLEEQDGTYTLSDCTDLEKQEWHKERIDLGFAPDLRSLTGRDGIYYMLSADGDLMRSADCMAWVPAGVRWTALLGTYGTYALGIKAAPEGLMHTSWPAGLCGDTPLEADFPVSGWSVPATIESEWWPAPMMFWYGGKKADGSLSGTCWGFDGNSWAAVSAKGGPLLEQAMLLPYWIARPSASLMKYNDVEAWVVMGGLTPDQKPNRSVWYSLDNGVIWLNGGQSLTLPEILGGFADADAVVSLAPYRKDALDWETGATRSINVSVEGTTIHWDCPTIYVFGGHTSPGAPLRDAIWRAAIARYTFVPII